MEVIIENLEKVVEVERQELRVRGLFGRWGKRVHESRESCLRLIFPIRVSLYLL